MTTASFIGAAPEERFTGSKLALLSGDQIVSILRDDRDDIPFPGCWDLPGGGREAGETPERCALRETEEELGLRLDPGLLHWRHAFVSTVDPTFAGWFFVARITAGQVGRIRMGDEGQRWRQMGLSRFLSLGNAVPYLQDRLRVYLGEHSGA